MDVDLVPLEDLEVPNLSESDERDIVTLKDLGNVNDLWQKATPSQQRFVCWRGMCASDAECCKLLKIDPANVTHWRTKSLNFVKLEAVYAVAPLQMTYMFYDDVIMPDIILQAYDLAKNDPSSRTRLEAIKALFKHRIDAATLMETKRQHESEFKLRFKENYDQH
jgi:hypothetical protein